MSQRLTGDPCRSPEDTVAWLGAVQAQDFGPAKWAVGRRTQGATEAQLDRAHAAGTILRTHVLRPTWHFVLPADILWLLTATGPGIRARNAHRYRQLGLDEATLTHSRDVLASALAGGLHLTRGQIAELLVAAGIAVDGQRLPYILMDAELSALVCSGPPSGTQHTYSLVRDRAPCALDLSRDAALAELARRYFTSHGPATAKDFAAWASLSASDVKLALGAAGSDLRHEEIDGVAFWSADERPSPASLRTPASPIVHLVQGYDEFIMGYSATKHVLARPGSLWTPSTPPVFSLVVLLDGRVAGWWRRTPKKGSVSVEVSLLEPLDADGVRALEAEAGRYGAYLDLPVTVVIADERAGRTSR